MTVCILLCILSVLIYHTEAMEATTFSVQCHVSGYIKISATPKQTGFIHIFDSSCIPQALQTDSDDATTSYALFYCHSFVLGGVFKYMWTPRDYHLLPYKVYDGNCLPESEVSISSNPTASAPSESLISGYLKGEVEMILSSSTPVLGNEFTIDVSLTTDSQDKNIRPISQTKGDRTYSPSSTKIEIRYYVMLLSSLYISYNNVDVPIVTIGCRDVDLTTEMTGDGLPDEMDEFGNFVPGHGSTTVSVILDLFIPGPIIDSETIVLNIEAVVSLCTLDSQEGCTPYVGACLGDSILYGRKRREAEKALTVSTRKTIVAFSQEASMNQFKETMRQELGLAEASRLENEGDICINKTSSAVVMVICFIGMVMCLIAAVWMFIKMRKSRRPLDNLKSEADVSKESIKY